MKYFFAISMDVIASLLQQRGPPYLPTSVRANAVILLASPLCLFENGVTLCIKEYAIPAPMHVPHAPWVPHMPPNIAFPLSMASLMADGSLFFL